MAVSIAGQEVKSAQDLTPRAQLALQTVVAGAQWLSWAIHDAKDAYPFASEESLVVGVQTGLHSRATVLFPKLGLLVSPRRLMELEFEDLELLILAENSTRKVSVRTKKTLMANQLWTAEDLATGRQFLDQLGVADAPVFQAAGLAGQVALFDLVDEDAEESEELAEFALAYATNSSEFVDLYQFALAACQGAKNSRLETVARALAVCEPLLWGFLRCPLVQQDLTPEEVHELIRGWLERGNTLGFPNVARGLRELAQFDPEAVARPQRAREALERFKAETSERLVAVKPGTSYCSQDGTQQFFELEADGSRLVLGRSRELGTLTLRSFSKTTS